MFVRQMALIGLAALVISVGPAFAADEVYVPLGDDGAILIVDPATNGIVGRIDGVPAVHGLAATPDGSFLVAGSYQEAAAGAALPPRPAGVSAADHAAHHAPRSQDAGAAAAVVSSVTILDVAERSVVRRVEVPGAVHHVAIGPQGRLAVVTHPGQDRISAIDLGSFQVVAGVPTGPAPNYAAFSPDGGIVFVSNAGNGTVSEVDTDRWIVRRNVIVGQGPEHLVLSSDGTTLYVNNADEGTVSVIDTPSGEVTSTIEIGDALHGIDLSDNESTLFVAAMGREQLVAVDLASGGQRSVALSPAPYHLAAIRGAGSLYVSSAIEPVIWVIDAETLETRASIPVPGTGHQIVQHHDG